MGQWALVATQLPSIGVLIWGWRHLTLLRKVVSLISSVQELHMFWISLNIFTPGLRDLEGEKHTNNLQYILWYHYPSHRVGWNMNPANSWNIPMAVRPKDRTDTSQLETSWNPVDLCWIMLHPLFASEIRARESTGKGRLGFRCRAVISYSFINISLACFIRRGDFTSPQPKPQENVRQVKATSTKQHHGRDIQIQNISDGQRIVLHSGFTV